MQLDLIARAACMAGGITMEQLASKRKCRQIAKVRAACGLVYRKWGMSYPQIAERLNYECHTSAMHICTRAVHWKETCPAFRHILGAASHAYLSQSPKFTSIRGKE